MKIHTLFYLLLICCLAGGCNTNIQTAPKNTIVEQPPQFTEADAPYADVYKPLDGTWKGSFTIYEDTEPTSRGNMDLKNLTLAHLDRSSLKMTNTIQVQQVYTSESPYFQRVTITDYYPDTNHEEVSQGVNKIEDGKMWCIVHKPDHTIVHEGSTRGEKTIIWQQNQSSPQRIEYFQETVDPNFYEIIGYGYYTGDKTTLSPKLWFYGKYERQ